MRGSLSTEYALQLPDGGRNAGLGDPHALGGLRKARQIGNADIDLHGFQLVHDKFIVNETRTV